MGIFRCGAGLARKCFFGGHAERAVRIDHCILLPL